jgi:hypothetical protein
VIKPEIATDVTLASISIPARFTFVLLISQADDAGLVMAAPRQLLGVLYPHDDAVTAPILLGWIEEMLGAGLLRRRTTGDSAPVLEIRNWLKHQRIDHPTPSRIAPTLVATDEREIRTDVASTSSGSRESFASKGEVEGEGEASPPLGSPPQAAVASPRGSAVGGLNGSASRQVRKAKKASAPIGAEEPGAFVTAMARYPRRDGSNPRQSALHAWRARVREGVDEALMLAGVERYRTWCEARGMTGSEHVMQAQRFFGPNREYEALWLIVQPPLAVKPMPPRSDEEVRAEIKHMADVVSGRRQREDGEQWWVAMQREANTTNKLTELRYAYERIQQQH